ncbi:MAG TPA: AraC family transcriptional regulator [Planctomycetota bacterium]|nr:AraC family transcriptional regulator [Planctomycetota bacterium]
MADTLKTVLLETWWRALEEPRTELLFPIFGHTRVDAKWDVPQRRLIEHLFYFVLEERFELRTQNGTHDVRPGTLLWLPSMCQHQMWIPRGQPTFTLYWFRVRVRVGPSARRVDIAPALPDGFLLMEEAWPLRIFIQTVVEELRARGDQHLRRVRAALTLLTTGAVRRSEASQPGRAVFTAAQRRKLQDYVARKIRSRIEPSELARELRLSHDYFSRVFRRSFGAPPKTWLMRERIQHAAQRLATSLLTVSEVAYEFGYRDVFLFSRQFKAVMGMGPKIWRKRAGLS